MRAGGDRANGKGKADFLFGNDGVDRLYGEDGSETSSTAATATT